MGILAQFEIKELKGGIVSKALKDLNERIAKFLEMYDEDNNKEIDVNELKEKRDELAENLGKGNNEMQSIIDSIKQLEETIIEYHKSSYHEMNKEKNNEEKTDFQTEENK